ncbi:aspartyl protease family protein [Hymenobacter negativus]|uniref:Aspartyl protease family protein n=1 Tax=Hymenobacter negativus TaxID=2795026 RepID=A0ABS3QAM3_9BACT|nr:aspartyl protease family protein [Hymenobacter negativus]MBO2008058.1 aspartyl protease family protein [Hymenobacter negativus]
MQLQRNLLVVNAWLNGYGPFNFLLDTGVSTSIITSPALADSLGLSHGERFRVVGAGGSDTGLLAYQSDNVQVTMPGIIAPRMSWLVLSEDVLNLSGYVGIPIHGILGSELFRSFVVTLKPEAGHLLLNDSATYRAPKGRKWANIPLSLERGKAYFTAPVQLSDSVNMSLKLVLDTGASHALSLELDSDPRLVGPAKRLPTDLGRGLTGIVQGYLGRVPRLQLGHFQLPSVLTSYPNSGDVHQRIDVPRNGNVGYELLKRFLLVIDYPHRRMLLRPNTHFRDAFEHDMSGMELLATGPDYRRFLVLRVMPDSPAAVAGLEIDEELLSINFLPVSVFTLTQLSHMLHSQDGRTLLLLLRRPNGELHSTTIRLKRQI